jgi:hypothetical protein
VGSRLAVLVTSNQVIAYDSYAIDHTPAAVTAGTDDFADGSSVSLVGLPAELPHALVFRRSGSATLRGSVGWQSIISLWRQE